MKVFASFLIFTGVAGGCTAACIAMLLAAGIIRIKDSPTARPPEAVASPAERMTRHLTGHELDDFSSDEMKYLERQLLNPEITIFRDLECRHPLGTLVRFTAGIYSGRQGVVIGLSGSGYIIDIREQATIAKGQLQGTRTVYLPTVIGVPEDAIETVDGK